MTKLARHAGVSPRFRNNGIWWARVGTRPTLHAHAVGFSPGTMGCMLSIRRDLVDAMIAHARRDHPDEACGVIAGPGGGDDPQRFIPMVNAARSTTFYEFDSADLLTLYRQMAARDEEPLVIYHSHTATEAYPSRTDVACAAEPNAHYVLISTRDPDTQEVRSYRIVDGEVTEEQVEIIDSVP